MSEDIPKVPTTIIRRYDIPREEFMELWIYALENGKFGEWLLAECKNRFDDKQPMIGGEYPVLTWAKIKSKMNYYRNSFNLTGIVESLPYTSGKNIQDKVAFEKAWKDKILAANDGAEARRRSEENK